MTTEAARFPFVSKTDILRAYRPGTEASDRTFRTLRQNGLVSEGLAIRRRRRGRVVGQLRCYAALNVDAVVLARHNRPREANRAAKEAARFETEWRPLVGEIAAKFDIQNFEAFRSLRNVIAHDLSPAIADIERLHAKLSKVVSAQVSEEFVRISQITDRWATLQLVSQHLAATFNEALSPITAVNEIIAKSIPRLDPRLSAAISEALLPLAEGAQRLAIDSFLTRQAGLELGDVALLRIEHTAGASLLSLLPAVQEDEAFVLDDDVAPYFSDEPLPSSAYDQVEARRARGEAIPLPPRTVPLAS